MAKNTPKNPVGRPKLADPELIKDSWCKIAVSFAFIFVFLICGVGVLTTRTPLQVITFKNMNNAKASVASIKNQNVRIIPAKSAETRIINADGTVTRIIPAK